MKPCETRCCCVLLGLLVGLSAVSHSSDAWGQDGPENAELAQQLLERMEVDQEIRFRMLNHMRESGQTAPDPEDEIVQGILTEMQEVDAANREWLREVIDQHGWPGKTLVGEQAAHAAWLLVQHADADREFQSMCLDLMIEAGLDEVSGVDIAYLTDRVLVGQGKPQKYGTQVERAGDRFVVKKVEDPEKLNERRAAVGLSTIEEYLELVQKMYAQSNAGDDDGDDDDGEDNSADDNRADDEGDADDGDDDDRAVDRSGKDDQGGERH